MCVSFGTEKSHVASPYLQGVEELVPSENQVHVFAILVFGFGVPGAMQNVPAVTGVPAKAPQTAVFGTGKIVLPGQ
jgi:hypothetical protein